MSWQQRYFKEQKVWVNVDDSGNLILQDGRVAMRYNNLEDAKTYFASPQNIGTEPVVASKKNVSQRQKKKSQGTKQPVAGIANYQTKEQIGSRVVSRIIPDELVNEDSPPNGIIEVHTDGACSGNPGPCGYGVVIRDANDYHEISAYLGTGTNNIGELMAIKVALEEIENRECPVHIYTDSTYCIGVLTKNWKAKVNQELIAEIKQLMKEFRSLQFYKIKGHAGFPLNERADFLATSSLHFADP